MDTKYIVKINGAVEAENVDLSRAIAMAEAAASGYVLAASGEGLAIDIAWMSAGREAV